ncbi:MAG: hypothetical protein RLP12_10385 [Ekhidna sp.]
MFNLKIYSYDARLVFRRNALDLVDLVAYPPMLDILNPLPYARTKQTEG